MTATLHQRADVVRSAERVRIARELHDGVSQTLYALVLAAERARSLCQQRKTKEAQQTIDSLVKLATEGQSELRAALTNLRTQLQECGMLISALEALAAQARLRHDLDVRLSLNEEPDLPATAKRALSMISREAVRNAAKHASCRNVEIVLRKDSDETILLITDDGRGFDADACRLGHFGLLSMRERAQAIGATFTLNSAPGAGTRVEIRVDRTRVVAQ